MVREWVGIELLERRAVVQQLEKLDLAGAEVHVRDFEIGFELRALQFQAIHIYRGHVSSLQTLAVDVKFVVPVS